MPSPERSIRPMATGNRPRVEKPLQRGLKKRRTKTRIFRRPALLDCRLPCLQFRLVGAAAANQAAAGLVPSTEGLQKTRRTLGPREVAAMDGRPSDSVQVYLTQMSNTPLLSRRDEFEAARRIEEARKSFRHAMLATDYVLQAAVTILEKVARGQMRLEVACEGPLTIDEQKRRRDGRDRAERADVAKSDAAEPGRFFHGHVAASFARAASASSPAPAVAAGEGRPAGGRDARSTAASQYGRGPAQRDCPADGHAASRVGRAAITAETPCWRPKLARSCAV